MTIGMLIESMAGKSAALHGVAHDSTPFRFNEQETAIEYFGNQLKQARYLLLNLTLALPLTLIVTPNPYSNPNSTPKP